MWLGPGGIVAIVIGAWAWLWVARRTSGRPWTDWWVTATSIAALQLELALATAQTWLVVAYADVARALSSAEREVFLDILRSQYQPIAWGAFGLTLFGVGLARSRGGWAKPTARPGVAAIAYAALQGLLVASSFGSVVGFHVVFVAVDPVEINRQGARVASQVLLAGNAAAWAGALGALVVLGWRAARAARER
jgi:hypothetical protein